VTHNRSDGLESMSSALQGERAKASFGARVAKAIMIAPITAYRWTIAPLLGVNCRHLPSCSDYAQEAIDKNGAWKGGWLTLARLCRCHPWGSHGYDPVPDVSAAHHPLAPWRYGSWRGSNAPRD
jgi:uncharacterized protein